MPKAKIHPRQGPEDDSKLRELVLLIATLSEGDKPFGKVKLNKLLFFSDFVAYRYFGKSITGHEYQKLPQGPAPRRLIKVIPSLGTPPKSDPDIVVRTHDYYGRDLQRPLALRSPDTSAFTFAELQLISNLVEKWRGKSAKEISDNSHKFIGWKLAQNGETIPYEVSLVGSREPTEHERRRGKELEKLASKKLA